MTNLHIYPSAFKFESRILRESNSLLEAKVVDNIIIASGWAPDLKIQERLGNNVEIRRFKTFFDKVSSHHKVFLVFKYCELYIRITLYFLRKPNKIINAHSLMVLPIAILLKLFDKQRKIIYDAHELETERFGLKGITQKVSKYFEGHFLRYCDRIIVVGDCIREWYIKEYSLSEETIYTVRNFNGLSAKDVIKTNYLREYFSLNPADTIFIYQGLLSKGRGIEIYLDTFKSLPTHCKLVLMGYGPLEDEIKCIAGLYKNILFHKAVQPSEIVSVTSSADIGLCLIENYCLSYYLSLPNKLFEYVNSGLPVIGSNFPEIMKLILPNKIGWVIEPSVTELTQIIGANTIEANKNLMQEGIKVFQNKFNWQIEQRELIKVYNSLKS